VGDDVGIFRRFCDPLDDRPYAILHILQRLSLRHGHGGMVAQPLAQKIAIAKLKFRKSQAFKFSSIQFVQIIFHRYGQRVMHCYGLGRSVGPLQGAADYPVEIFVLQGKGEFISLLKTKLA
jgi:hypothetical protein